MIDMKSLFFFRKRKPLGKEKVLEEMMFLINLFPKEDDKRKFLVELFPNEEGGFLVELFPKKVR